MKKLSILGSTGSIGKQTLEVIRMFPDQFQVTSMVAGNNSDLFLNQIHEFKPSLVYSQNKLNPADLPSNCKIVANILEIVQDDNSDLICQSLSGTIGLFPTLQALQSGKSVILSNKEPIVMAGNILMDEAVRFNSQILPVDSEPSAIWQCLRGEDYHQNIKKVLITGSGGPFLNVEHETLKKKTPKDALKHPTWNMGEKISIDSATLMNKALEVIEAYWLFDLDWEQIEVVIHPESIVHSMVEFNDGSIKAQLSPTSMLFPIQHALFYPERIHTSSTRKLEITEIGNLSFQSVDFEKYPCFQIGIEAGKASGTYPAVLIGADEVAVNMFLSGTIKFTDIPKVISRTLDINKNIANPSIEQIIESEKWGKQTALKIGLNL